MDCHRSYKSAHYQSNKPEYLRKNAARIAQALLYVREIKSRTACFDCGNHFPHVAMDFDHVGVADKDRDISALIHAGVSRERLDLEIAKCELVCANCHRVRTYTRRQARLVEADALV